eukprot:15022166-Alexandrium_andersonii.AAC.1
MTLLPRTRRRTSPLLPPRPKDPSRRSAQPARRCCVMLPTSPPGRATPRTSWSRRVKPARALGSWLKPLWASRVARASRPWRT